VALLARDIFAHLRIALVLAMDLAVLGARSRMTTLYRTPNLVLDQHEWHAAVLLNHGRISLVYKWRPLSLKQYRWSLVSQWKGPKPKDLCNRFWMFRSHIRKAMLSEEVRAQAIQKMRGPPTAAQMRNAA
jgi:hypothetical protein